MNHIKAVVFDWAGTMIDFGSFAPMGVFVEAFKHFDIDVSIAQARTPMGMPKWDHIRAMMDDADIAQKWQQRYGELPSDADVDKVYATFVPMNEAVVANYATLVPGALDTINWLRAQGIKIGSTTGYTRSIMEKVLPKAAEQGYTPDNLICADDLPEGRPGPLGMYQCFIDLVAYPPSAVIKVDDTAPGIAEGAAAGCINVGVTLSGNIAGKTPEEIAACSAEEIEHIRQQAEAVLREAGADYIIDTVADLPALLQRLTSNDA